MSTHRVMAVVATKEERDQAAVAASKRLAAGRLRVQLALEHVEEAQRELGRAQQELFSVIGFVPEGDRLNKLYAKVKDEWYRLHARFEKTYGKPRGDIGMIDRTATPADEVPHQQGCGRVGWNPR